MTVIAIDLDRSYEIPDSQRKPLTPRAFHLQRCNLKRARGDRTCGHRRKRYDDRGLYLEATESRSASFGRAKQAEASDYLDEMGTKLSRAERHRRRRAARLNHESVAMLGIEAERHRTRARFGTFLFDYRSAIKWIIADREERLRQAETAVERRSLAAELVIAQIELCEVDCLRAY